MMPNSPSETIIAARLPLRNEGMRKRSKREHRAAARAARGRRPQSTKATPASEGDGERDGIGERSNGQVQSPIAGGVSSSHQP